MLGTRHPYRREEQETIESASRAARTGAASLAANAQPMESITSRLTWCTTSLGRSWYSRLATQLVRRSTMGVIMLSHLLRDSQVHAECS